MGEWRGDTFIYEAKQKPIDKKNGLLAAEMNRLVTVLTRIQLSDQATNTLTSDRLLKPKDEIKRVS